MSQIEKNTILNKRPVIFLITPEVSALQIKMLASNKIEPPKSPCATRTWNVNKGKHMQIEEKITRK